MKNNNLYFACPTIEACSRRQLDVCARVHDLRSALEGVLDGEFTNISAIEHATADRPFLLVRVVTGRGMQAWDVREHLRRVRDDTIPTNVVEMTHSHTDEFLVETLEGEKTLFGEYRIEAGGLFEAGVGLVTYVRAQSEQQARLVLSQCMHGTELCVRVTPDVEVNIYFDSTSPRLKITPMR